MNSELGTVAFVIFVFLIVLMAHSAKAEEPDYWAAKPPITSNPAENARERDVFYMGHSEGLEDGYSDGFQNGYCVALEDVRTILRSRGQSVNIYSEECL